MTDIINMLNYSTAICNDLRKIDPKLTNINRRTLGRVYSVAMELNTMLTTIMLLNQKPNKHLEEDLT